MMTDRLTLTVKEAAPRLGVSARALYEWCERGLIPHVKVGHRVLIPVAALEQWVRATTEGGQRPQPVAPRQEPVPFRAPRSRRRRVL